MIKEILYVFLLLTVSQLQAEYLLLIGNSMTLYVPKQRIGWLGNWGIAASVENTRLASYLKWPAPDVVDRAKIPEHVGIAGMSAKIFKKRS